MSTSPAIDNRRPVLGQRAMDDATKIRGLLTAHCQYYRGDSIWLITPADSDGTREPSWVPEARVVLL